MAAYRNRRNSCVKQRSDVASIPQVFPVDRRLVRRGVRATGSRAVHGHRSPRRKHGRSGGVGDASPAIGLVGDQTAPKSRVSLGSEYLSTQPAGQTLFKAINQLPGVNFTDSDPYGTSGGNLRIRGFDGSRVSVTFDGVPFNDSGNYALFTNQMLDPELVDRVDVNLGTTDVDSPTASATGGTVAYRTKRPTEEFSSELVLSGGGNNYPRGFLRIDTGEWAAGEPRLSCPLPTRSTTSSRARARWRRSSSTSRFARTSRTATSSRCGLHYNENRNAFYRNASLLSFEQFGLGYENLESCTRDLPTRRRCATTRIRAMSWCRRRRPRRTTCSPIPRAARTTTVFASIRRIPATCACSRCGICPTMCASPSTPPASTRWPMAAAPRRSMRRPAPTSVRSATPTLPASI